MIKYHDNTGNYRNSGYSKKKKKETTMPEHSLT